MAKANFTAKNKLWQPAEDAILSLFQKNILEEKNKIKPTESQIIIDKAIEVLRNSVDPNQKRKETKCGLVFGDVQSGKTLSFTSLALAAAEKALKTTASAARAATKKVTRKKK